VPRYKKTEILVTVTDLNQLPIKTFIVCYQEDLSIGFNSVSKLTSQSLPGQSGRTTTIYLSEWPSWRASPAGLITIYLSEWLFWWASPAGLLQFIYPSGRP